MMTDPHEEEQGTTRRSSPPTEPFAMTTAGIDRRGKRLDQSNRSSVDDSEDYDAKSLAELTSFGRRETMKSSGGGGSVVSLHPHHNGKTNKSSSSRRMSTSDDEQRRHSSRGHRRHLDDHGVETDESCHIRRSTRHARNHDALHGDEEEDDRHYRGGSSRRYRTSRSSTNDHSDSFLSRIPFVVDIISSTIGGVNIKTVLLCMMGMTLILKLNAPPTSSLPSSLPSSSDAPQSFESATMTRNTLDTTGGVRGAMIRKVGDEEHGEDSQAILDALEEAEAGGVSDGSGGFLTRMKNPPIMQPQQVLSSGGQQLQQIGIPQQQQLVDNQQQMIPITHQQRISQQANQLFVPEVSSQQLPQQQVPQPGNAVVGFRQQPQEALMNMPQASQYMLGQSSILQLPQVQQTVQQSTNDQSSLSSAATEQWAKIVTGQQPLSQPQPSQEQPQPQEQPQTQEQIGNVADPANSAENAPLVAMTTTGAEAVVVNTSESAVVVDVINSPVVASNTSGITSAIVVDATTSAIIPNDVPQVAASSGGDDVMLQKLNNFKDTWDPYETTDIPMFWHIPKAGGSSIKDAMGGCHRFIQATEFGVTDGHINDKEVAIVYPVVPGAADTDRSPFVNIDSTTVAGIQRARDMRFADSQLADVVVSPFVFELNDLFTQTAKGRLFSVFRHPIERAVSMFYYIRVADWEPSYKPELKDWSLEQYAVSDVVENNWMTRQLSNQISGDLSEENLRNAMEVIRSKMLVGLMSKIEPSMTRFEKFFRWTYHVNPTNQETCRERLMGGGSNSNKANKKPLGEEDEAWGLLALQNNFDLQLYDYIEKLFDEQEAFVTGMPDNFRNIDATCCKCDPATFPPEGFTCPEAVKNVQ